MQRVKSDICYVFTLDVEFSLNLFSRRNGAFLVSDTYSGYFTCHSTIYNLPLQLHSVLAIYMYDVLWIQIVIPRCFLSPVLFFLRCERYLHVCDVLVSLNKCKPKKKKQLDFLFIDQSKCAFNTAFNFINTLWLYKETILFTIYNLVDCYCL